MNHLVLVGPPGAGKGTLAKQLTDFTQVSTGDLLRAEIKSGSKLGKYVKDLIDNGNFVDDDTMLDILKNNLPKKQSLIFDGYPRNITQIPYFEKLVKEIDNDAVVEVVYFDINLKNLEDRIINRVSCSKCGEIYHLKNKPTKKENTCDICGGSTAKRADDTPKIVKQRLKIYEETTAPIMDHFKKNYKVHTLDANKSAEEVVKELKENL